MPTDTAQGLQCVPISNKTPALFQEEKQTDAATFATEGEAEHVPENTWNIDASAFWQEEQKHNGAIAQLLCRTIHIRHRAS